MGILEDLAAGRGLDTSALGGINLNQLVRPPDPLGAALAEMSQRFATAGQASRLPVSTLGAIGSALGGAGAAANTAQTQYLDQAIKLQTLTRALQAAGYDRVTAEIWAKAKLGQTQPGAAAAPAAPAAPLMNPGMTTFGAGGPFAAGGPFDVPNYSRAFAPAAGVPPVGNTGIGGGDQGAGARMQLTSLLGAPGGGLLDPGGTTDPRTGGDLLLQGGPAAGVTQANFRPASLVAAGGGAGSGAASDLVTGGALPAALRGLLAGSDSAGGEDPLAGLLGKSPDEVIPSGASREDVQLASMTAPRSKGNIVSAESGGNPNVGYGGVDLSNAPRDPETGFPQWAGRQGPAGISHAAGKYQFQPGTWAEGARALGVNDFSEKSQDAVYDWTRAKYGDAPWRASEGGGARPGMMLAQYAPVQGGFPALVGPGSGTIPGLNMTPLDVATMNAFAGLAGRGAPFKELLDLYYKSPEYLRQSAQETEAGKTAISGPAQIAIDQAKAMNDIKVGMAKDHVMMDPAGSGQVVQIPGYAAATAADKDEQEKVANKWQTQIENTKAKFDTVIVPILQKDNTIADTPMSRYDRDQKQQMQGNRAPQPGDIVGKPSAPLSSDFQYKMKPDGTVAAEPIPNTPAAQKVADLAREQAISDRQLQVSRDAVVAAADRAEYLAKTYPKTTTGVVGSKLTGVWQPSADMMALIETIASRTTLDQLKAARAGSVTGASGFGQLSDVEGKKLENSVANLRQSQSAPQFLENLAIVKKDYIDAVHGPGAYKQMSDAGVLKMPTAAPQKWEEGHTLDYQDGSQQQFKNGVWVQTKPPTMR